MKRDWIWRVEYWSAADQTWKLGSDNVWATEPERAIGFFRQANDFDVLSKVMYRVTPIGPAVVFHWQQPVMGRWVEHSELVD